MVIQPKGVKVNEAVEQSPASVVSALFKTSLNNSFLENSKILENLENSDPAGREQNSQLNNNLALINAVKNALGEQTFEALSNRDAQMLSILDFSTAQMSSAVDAVFDIIETYAPLQPPKIIELSHALKAYYGSNASIFEHYKKASLLLAIEDSFNDFVASSNVNLLASDSVDMALI